MANKKIVVLQRGWVVVGEYSKDGHEIVVSNASVIRRWGTTRGLGEISENGPTSLTILDKCGTVRAHEQAIVMAIDCNQDKWK